MYMTSGVPCGDALLEPSSTPVIYITSGLIGPDALPLPELTNVKLAQVFGVYDQFVPTKASVYLRQKTYENIPYILIDGGVAVDALNFSELSQGTNKLLPSTTFADYSGHGHLYVDEFDSTGPYGIVEYPIKASSVGDYNIMFRCRKADNPFVMRVYFDDVLIDTINENMVATGVWNWFFITVEIPDTEIHTLGLSLREADSALDKIIMSSEWLTLDTVNNYADAYITIHTNLYTVDTDNRPDSEMYIYDYKTTIDEVRTDDWYNFSLNFLEESRAIDFEDKHALVLYSVGSNQNKYIVWEMLDADEDTDGPSAIKG